MEIEQIIETMFAAAMFNAAMAARSGADVTDRVEDELCFLWERYDALDPSPTTEAIGAVIARYVERDDEGVPSPLPVTAWGNIAPLRSA